MVHQGTSLPLWYNLQVPIFQDDSSRAGLIIKQICMVLESKYSSTAYVIIDSYHAKNISVLMQALRYDWWGLLFNDVRYSNWCKRFHRVDSILINLWNIMPLSSGSIYLKCEITIFPPKTGITWTSEKSFAIPYILCRIIVFFFCSYFTCHNVSYQREEI